MALASKTTHAPSRRLHVATLAGLAVLSAWMLAGCEAGVAAAKIGEDLGEGVGNALACALRNCKESSTVETENVSPRFTITQVNGVVQVDAWLGQSANALTTLMPSAGDSLSASNGDGPRQALSDKNGDRFDWVTSFVDASAQPRVTVNFHRGSNLYPNTVTLPKPLSLVSPLGPQSLTRSSGQFDVKLASADPLPGLRTSADGSCKRADGSSFEVKNMLLSPRVDAGDAYLFHLRTADLDKLLTDASVSANQNLPQTPALATCSLVLSWTISVDGTVSPSLSGHGWIRAKRTVTTPISYDSRL